VHERLSPVSRLVFNKGRLVIVSVDENSTQASAAPAALISSFALDAGPEASFGSSVSSVYLEPVKGLNRQRRQKQVMFEAKFQRLDNGDLLLTTCAAGLDASHEPKSYRFSSSTTFDAYNKLDELTRLGNKTDQDLTCCVRMRTGNFAKMLSHFSAAGQLFRIAIASHDKMEFSVVSSMMNLSVRVVRDASAKEQTFADLHTWTGTGTGTGPMTGTFALAQVEAVTKDILASTTGFVYLRLAHESLMHVHLEHENEHLRSIAIIGRCCK
jgi:hypothetical protein